MVGRGMRGLFRGDPSLMGGGRRDENGPGRERGSSNSSGERGNVCPAGGGPSTDEEEGKESQCIRHHSAELHIHLIRGWGKANSTREEQAEKAIRLTAE